MAFTAGEVTNIANSALDFYLNKGTAFQQAIQTKPLISKLESGAKTFPGGKGDISIAIQGTYGDGTVNSDLRGYTHDDTVSFFTPANVKRAAFTWREHHIGLMITHTELKIDGISVTDTNGEGTSNHSGREMTALVNLMENKLADFGERYAVSSNSLYWGDGTSDAKAMAGIRSILTANPTTGSVGGINRATSGNEYWRNRARTASSGGAVTSSVANGGALLQVLQNEKRQLMRYGGNPTVFLAGSDFIAAMETEMRANGYYTQNGFSGRQDGAMGALSFGGVNIEYDPTLDDLSLQKRAYWWDPRHIFLMKMENEWKRQHTPARPSNQFLMYRSITCTGQIVATQCNSALVIDIA
jgi:hypothetical protein